MSLGTNAFLLQIRLQKHRNFAEAELITRQILSTCIENIMRISNLICMQQRHKKSICVQFGLYETKFFLLKRNRFQ